LGTEAARSSSVGRNILSSPILQPKQLHFKARCLYNFRAETADELSMEIDVDTTVERGTDGWWFGTSLRGAGWIPSNFVERL
jgi:SH3 domain